MVLGSTRKGAPDLTHGLEGILLGVSKEAGEPGTRNGGSRTQESKVPTPRGCRNCVPGSWGRVGHGGPRAPSTTWESGRRGLQLGPVIIPNEAHPTPGLERPGALSSRWSRAVPLRRVRSVRWERVLHTPYTSPGRASQLWRCFLQPSALRTGRPLAISAQWAHGAEPSVPQVRLRDSNSNPSTKVRPSPALGTSTLGTQTPRGPGLRRRPHVWGLPGNSDCSPVLRCSRERFPIHRRGAI